MGGLLRAAEREGETVDFMLSPRREIAAVRAFLRKALKSPGTVPSSVALDGYAASHRAVRDLQENGCLPGKVKLRSVKYLSNLFEQDHRNAKLRIRPILGFKRFKCAATTIAGIELLRSVRKGLFSLDQLHVQVQVVPVV